VRMWYRGELVSVQLVRHEDIDLTI